MSFETERVILMINNSQRLGQIKQKLGNIRYRSERVPQFREIRSSQSYEDFGAKIGISGTEVSLLIDNLISDPSDSDLQALKNMMMLVKLSNPGVLDVYRDQVERNNQAYEAEMALFNDAVEKRKQYEDELEAIMKEANFIEIRDEWRAMILEMQKYVEEHENKVETFEGDKKEFFELLNKSSRFVRVEYAEDGTGLAKVDWKHVSEKLNIEHINTMLRNWARIVQEKMTSGIEQS